MSPTRGHPEYLEPYREAVARLGPSFGALLWRDEDFQRTRFRVLAEVAAAAVGSARRDGRSRPGAGLAALNGLVVGDLGCGRADLLGWLGAAGVELGGYVGVDGVPELIEDCERRSAEAGWPSASFLKADFAADTDLAGRLVRDHGVDLFVVSGSLNTLHESEALAAVGRAFDAAESRRGIGVVFNFLSDLDRADRDAGPARRFDTFGVISWAAARTNRWSFRHDYLDAHDATVGMFVD